MSYCNRCGRPHTSETRCLRDEEEQPMGEYPEIPTSFEVGVRAAADQAHAHSEQILNELIKWWKNSKGNYKTSSKSDEISVITYLLSRSETAHASTALLATAIVRLLEGQRDE